MKALVSENVVIEKRSKALLWVYSIILVTDQLSDGCVTKMLEQCSTVAGSWV